MNITYSEVFTFDNLYKAYKKCLRGVRYKNEVQRFINQDLMKLRALYKELIFKKYKPNNFKEFNIIERGKPRHISAHSFRDRIVQRCLCDNYLIPILSKSLIYDCGATLKNKGVSFSKNRLNTHLHKYYRKYGCLGYCLTIDIHHYFDNISHAILKKELESKIIDKDLFNLVCLLIDKFKGQYGLGLGSQISQICALFYLCKLDHYIKEKLSIKYYGRYMDDIYLIHNDKEYLYKCLKIISKLFKTLGLILNKKTKIHKLTNGFIYVKTKYILTKNGKILHILTTKTFKIMKRKIKKGINIYNILPSWIAYISNFDAHNKLLYFLSSLNLNFYKLLP